MQYGDIALSQYRHKIMASWLMAPRHYQNQCGLVPFSEALSNLFAMFEMMTLDCYMLERHLLISKQHWIVSFLSGKDIYKYHIFHFFWCRPNIGDFFIELVLMIYCRRIHLIYQLHISWPIWHMILLCLEIKNCCVALTNWGVNKLPHMQQMILSLKRKCYFDEMSIIGCTGVVKMVTFLFQWWNAFDVFDKHCFDGSS